MARRLDTTPYAPRLDPPIEKIQSLFTIIANLDTQELKQFMINSSFPLNFEDPRTGENLIHKTIISNHHLKKEFQRLNMIKFLVQNGVDPDKPNKENQTPLHYACKQQYTEIALYLISLNVDVNYQDNYGFTPLHLGLQGLIKPLEPSFKPADMVQRPINIDMNKLNDLIEIKTKIWDKIKDENFIQSLNKTLDASIFSNSTVRDRLQDLRKDIINFSTKPNKENELPEIRRQVEILIANLKSEIENKWNKFPNLSEIEIHDRTEINPNKFVDNNSYVITNYNLSPLRNANVKRIVQNDIKKLISSIQDKCIIKIDNFDFKDCISKFENFYYLSLINDYFSKGIKSNDIDYFIHNNKINDNDDKTFNNHFIDYADNYYDWNIKKFIGGSREILINHNFNVLNTINLSINSIESKVLNILCSFTNIIDVRELTIDTIDTIKTDEFERNVIKMCYYAIFDVNKLLNMKSTLQDLSLQFYNNVIDKFNKVDLPTFIYGIYTKYKSLINQYDNLACEINCEFYALVSALHYKNKNISLSEALNHSFKKFYYSEIVTDDKLDNQNKIYNIIRVLLSDVPDLNNITFGAPLTKPEIENINLSPLFNPDSYNTDEIKNILSSIKSKLKEKVSSFDSIDIENNDLDLLHIFTFISNGCRDKELEMFNLHNINQLFFPINTNRNIEILNYLKNNKATFNLSYLHYLFEIFHLDNNNDGYYRFCGNKYNEARHLGLHFSGLIPFLNNYNNYSLTIKNKQANIFIKNNKHNLINNDLLIHIIRSGNPRIPNQELDEKPLGGFYIDLSDNTVLLTQHDEIKLKYFHYNRIKYRPPFKKTIQCLEARNKYYISKLLQHILEIGDGSSNKTSVKDIIGTSEQGSKLEKIFIDYYPILGLLTNLYNFIYGGNYDLDSLIIELNKYNGYILLFYYLFSNEKLYKIPKFNYFELPLMNQKGKFIYYDNPNNSHSFVNPGTDNPNDASPEVNVNTKTLYLLNSMNYQLIPSDYILGNYKIIKDDFIRAKNEKLPPSIKSVLNEFYKFNLSLLIVKLFDEIQNDSTSTNEINKLIIDYLNKYKLPIKVENKTDKYYLYAKLIEEVVKQQSENYIIKQISALIKLLFGDINSQDFDLTNILPSRDFQVHLSSINLKLDRLDNEVLGNSFSIVQMEEDKENNFIIYPDEYTNIELLKSKSTLNISERMITELLNKSCNPYLLDTNNQSAIYPILKMHYYDMILKLKDKIDYRDFKDILPFSFLLNEHRIHTEKLTNGLNKYNEWLNHFTFSQMMDVKELFMANDKIKFQKPKYLEKSFSVVAYLTNHYLSERIYRYDNAIEHFKDLIKLESNFETYSYLNEVISEMKIYKNDYLNILSEIIQDKEIQKKNLQMKIDKMTNGLTKTQYISTLGMLNNEIKSYKDELEKNSNIILSKETLSSRKVLEKYDKLLSLGKLLSEFVNKDLQGSNDLLTFKVIDKENDIFNKNKINDITNKLNDIKLLNDFYEHINKTSEMYFTFGDYIENNKTLEFVNDLLIFMTRHFIIQYYELTVRRVLSIYLNSIGITDITQINNRINHLFNFEQIIDNQITGRQEYKSFSDILRQIITPKIVLSTVQIFKNENEKMEYNNQSVKELLESALNLFTVNTNTIFIPSESVFFKNMREVNNYFDTFVPKAINNWQIVIENTFKFNINQGRIIKCIYNIMNE